ncbi:hypothetical protein SAMN04487910_2783 [Aquimarina amphilecti]|uniref:TonB protein C-terminal n=1 Tax=Aquimarina amphilecti TaxID=1038014 RepID=A0A1H7RLB8_AQUAM|nr:hypothetical protein [Aquimarina amphilecti]SEL60925.1 hypothetical protein SAMN04487910_2783 [Aquimarina amphilecti]
MIKRVYYISILVFTLFSCDNLVLKKENQKQVLKEKWNEIDKNQVDEPPLFEACKHVSEEEIELCFHNTINEQIGNYLQDQTITVKEPINDTIWVPLLITKDGDIVLEDFLVPDIITSQIPDFKDILEESIDNLPNVEPAHTRSTPVNTRYKLPLVISIN